MQALKKAERAKQEQKESLKQLEEANLKQAEGASAAASVDETVPEVAPQAETASDFPSLEMAFGEPEPVPPPSVPELAAESSLSGEPPSGEPLLALDMPVLDMSLHVDGEVREEPRLELSFADIPAPAPEESATTAEPLLLTPDENLLSFEEPPPPPALSLNIPAAFSLELPSIIEPTLAVPPPVILIEPPEPLVTLPEVPEAAPLPEEKLNPAAVSPAPAQAIPEEDKAPAATAAKEKRPPGETIATKPAQQEIAKTVFAAKQSARNPRMRIYGIGAGILLGIVSGGAYYYWQEITAASAPQISIQQPGQTVQPPPPEVAAPQPPAAPDDQSLAKPAEAQVATPNPADQPAPVSPKPAEAPAAATPKPDARKSAVPREESAATVAKPTAPKEEVAKPEPQKMEHVASYKETGPTGAGIKIVRSSGAALTNPLLSKAYQAFMTGDGEQAGQLYQQVLRQEPRNRDALQGMAALAMQRQQPAQAAAIYNRMLENDPNDAEALAGLTSLQGMSDPVQHESRLKNLLAKNPNALAAHFALGNLYFRQSRWAEAQSAFFRAYSGNPDNPDYVYNLAVSLDQLGQEKLALDYYQRAAALAKNNVAAFDRTALQSRIRDLTPQPGGEAK